MSNYHNDYALNTKRSLINIRLNILLLIYPSTLKKLLRNTMPSLFHNLWNLTLSRALVKMLRDLNLHFLFGLYFLYNKAMLSLNMFCLNTKHQILYYFDVVQVVTLKLYGFIFQNFEIQKQTFQPKRFLGPFYEIPRLHFDGLKSNMVQLC